MIPEPCPDLGCSLFSEVEVIGDLEANLCKFDSFPLTLALSPRRGNRGCRCGQIQRRNALSSLEMILPLPKGKGRGEGKRGVRTPTM